MYFGADNPPGLYGSWYQTNSGGYFGVTAMYVTVKGFLASTTGGAYTAYGNWFADAEL